MLADFGQCRGLAGKGRRRQERAFWREGVGGGGIFWGGWRVEAELGPSDMLDPQPPSPGGAASGCSCFLGSVPPPEVTQDHIDPLMCPTWGQGNLSPFPAVA